MNSAVMNVVDHNQESVSFTLFVNQNYLPMSSILGTGKINF